MKKNIGAARALVVALFVGLLVPPLAALAMDLDKQLKFDIPAQDLSSALIQFSKQAGVQVVLSEDVAGQTTRGLKGRHAIRQALEQLLGPARLRYRVAGETTISVARFEAAAPASSTSLSVPKPEDIKLARAENTERKTQQAAAAKEDDSSGDGKGMPEILVRGSKSTNTDIQRTEEDAQPYVVYSGDEIRQSGALNLEEFLRTRLPMNATTPNTAGGPLMQSTPYPAGGINLRGLGTNQTLILVDGRRLPGVATGRDFSQPNIEGIAPSSIERIEILPATASGIYGGSATGGAINIILKHDFAGLDLEGIYGNTFDSDVGRTQVNLTGGFSLEQGRTQVTVSASHAGQNELSAPDRDFLARGFDQLLRNFPTSSSVPSSAFGTTPMVFSATGVNLVLDPELGGAPLDSPWTTVPAGYAGPSTDQAAMLLANAGHLDVTGRPSTLYGAPTLDSISLNIRRGLTDHLDAYLDLYGNRSVNRFQTAANTTVTLPGAAPNNPFQQDIRVNLPLYENGFSTDSRVEAKSRRLNAGLIARLPLRWSATLDYGRSENETLYDAEINNGVKAAGTAVLQAAALTDLRKYPIADIRSLFNIGAQTIPTKNTLEDVSLRVGGPLVGLPGGALMLSGLIEHRRERNDDTVVTNISATAAPSYSWMPSASQEVQSAYLELRAPLLRQLELMASGRHDEYKTRWPGTSVYVASPDGPFPAQTLARNQPQSTDYTLGLRYTPVRDLTVRASYGTGFLPPNLGSLKSTSSSLPASAFPYPDPRRGGDLLTGDPVTHLLQLVSGGNPDIQPEQSESVSYGLIFTPRLLEGLRLSVDVTDIRKKGEISGGTPVFILDNEALYPGRIVRGPVDAGYSVGPVTSIDISVLNLYRTDVRAVDAQLDYTRGGWHFYLLATREISFERQTSLTLATVDSVGFSDGPLEWRGNVGVDWTAGPWTLGWNAQYFGALTLCTSSQTAAVCAAGTNVRALGTDRMPHQLYNDAFLRYDFGRAAPLPLLANTEISLGIQNLFDRSPLLIPPAGYSTFGDPRMRRFTLTLRRHFGL